MVVVELMRNLVVAFGVGVFHERVPALLAAIHSGDCLLKLLVIAAIVTVWP